MNIILPELLNKKFNYIKIISCIERRGSMDFINKLIKRGIFGLALCFTFFVFFGGVRIGAAADCTIKINDDDQYLVLNTGIDWSDSGVTIYCDSVKQETVSVVINDGTPIVTNELKDTT